MTGVPAERKGERLAVLHTVDEERISNVIDKLAASGLPNVFIPRKEQFSSEEQLPLLGTGKLDLRELNRIAAEAASAKNKRTEAH